MQTTSDYILETSRDYSIYVCSSRAIPNVSDGLKDSQRKALWIMKTKSEKIKTVSLAGEMISSGLFLHGDASASMTASMLAAPYVNNVPLLHGIGAFGTRVAPVEGIGAPRYTYLKKSSVTDSLVYSDLDVVPLVDNYDGSTKQPLHFLPLIPLVLLNGVSGIAVGWSTAILPRNLKKIISATQQALKGQEPKGLEPSFDYLNVDVRKVEGDTWEFRGRCDIIDSSTIKITELPPSLNLEGAKKRLNKLEDDGLIQTYVDRSTDLIDITVKFKRGEVKDWTPDKAVDFFKLKEKSAERIVVIDWNGSSIRQYESAEILVKEFVKWRLNWYTARFQKMLDDDSYELKFWRGIEACFKAKLPERLGKKANKNEVETEVVSITANIGLDDLQVDKIINLPTFKWAADFRVHVTEQINSLVNSVAGHTAMLANPQARVDLYLSELEALKKLK